MAYRILQAGEDITYGLSAAAPLSDSPLDTQLEVLQQNSQYQLLTNSITWVLYHIARSYFVNRVVPRVVLVDLSGVVGSALRAKVPHPGVSLTNGFCRRRTTRSRSSRATFRPLQCYTRSHLRASRR